MSRAETAVFQTFSGTFGVEMTPISSGVASLPEQAELCTDGSGGGAGPKWKLVRDLAGCDSCKHCGFWATLDG